MIIQRSTTRLRAHFSSLCVIVFRSPNSRFRIRNFYSTMDQNSDLFALLNLDQLSSTSNSSLDSNSTPTPIRDEPQKPIEIVESVSVTDSESKIDSVTSLGSDLNLTCELSKIVAELRSQSRQILELNPSRRIALLAHLNESLPFPSKSTLSDWINGHRDQDQEAAFSNYLEEVGLVFLGQTLLLKSWADRGITTFYRPDLSAVNHKISVILRCHLSLGKENWKVACRTLYSWYRPSPTIQEIIWNRINEFELSSTDSKTFTDIIHKSKSTSMPSRQRKAGYDDRFYSALWEEMNDFGFDPNRELNQAIPKKISGFTPTLRNGSATRFGPAAIKWYAYESQPFLLLEAEIASLWLAPISPPHWTLGNGIEIHQDPQLSFALRGGCKSTEQEISEMAACDIGVVVEEQVIRPNHRSSCGLKFKENLNQFDDLKNFKGKPVSLGTVQTLFALDKLRPGALLWWCRETPFGPQESQAAITELLDKSLLICEWNLSGLSHSLPSKTHLFPEYLYLLKKKTPSDISSSHSPVRIHVKGELRSHVEFESLMKSTLHNFFEPDGENSRFSARITRQSSRITQDDWSLQWPEEIQNSEVDAISSLNKSSLQLGQLAIVKSIQFKKGKSLSPSSLWVHSNYDPDTRKNTIQVNRTESEDAFFLSFPSQAWVGPIEAYLNSKIVIDWLSYRFEKRTSKWKIKLADIAALPIPKSLVNVVRSIENSSNESEKSQIELLLKRTRLDRESIQEWMNAVDQNSNLITHLFVHLSNRYSGLIDSRSKLRGIIGPNKEVNWNSLLEMLPKGERVAFTRHPDIQIVGQIPTQIPIIKMNLDNRTGNRISFITDRGLQCEIRGDSKSLISMVWNQIKTAENPTWSELVSGVKLPRTAEIAQTTASEFIDISSKLDRDLSEISVLMDMTNPGSPKH